VQNHIRQSHERTHSVAFCQEQRVEAKWVTPMDRRIAPVLGHAPVLRITSQLTMDSASEIVTGDPRRWDESRPRPKIRTLMTKTSQECADQHVKSQFVNFGQLTRQCRYLTMPTYRLSDRLRRVRVSCLTPPPAQGRSTTALRSGDTATRPVGPRMSAPARSSRCAPARCGRSPCRAVRPEPRRTRRNGG
jgi:hypothetical protein